MSKESIGSFFGCLIVGGFSAFLLLLFAIGTFWIIALPPTPNRTNFRIYSSDKKQCLTIITNGHTRYIINGNHKYPPKSHYIKLDISGTPKLGDEIGICWNNGKYEWEMVNDKTRIVENRLDTFKYKFNTNWEKDKHGIPNATKYHKPNCGTVDLLNMKTYDETIIIEN